MDALIICNDTHLSWFLPYLLARSGFTVDVIAKTGVFKKSAYVRKLFLVPHEEQVGNHAVRHVEQNPNKYTWIIPCEDQILLDVLRANTSDDIKLKILPVMSKKDFSHLYSKTRLAEIFRANGIPAPHFENAHSLQEAQEKAKRLRFPILVKRDSSCGGQGVYACGDADDLEKLSAVFDGAPVLLQEEIAGTPADLSALFFEEKLVHFSYSAAHRWLPQFGPSVVRDYVPTDAIPKTVVYELQKIGKALGANGYVNISCIKQDDGKRYYFEADMRPNVWQDYTTYIGDDQATYIRHWFETRKTINPDRFCLESITTKAIRLPYFLRLKRHQILLNRYNVRKYIPMHDRALVKHLLLQYLILRPLISFAKRIIPKPIRQNIKIVLIKYGAF